MEGTGERRTGAQKEAKLCASISGTYGGHAHAEMVAVEALELDECEELGKVQGIVDRNGQFDVSVVARALRLHHVASDAPKGVKQE